jgi:thioesterase domain-containing protein
MSIEIMAGTYIAAMQRSQPHGPYHIAGWSMGGLVAYEIAQQLHAAGEEVGLVVLFDTRADTRPEGFDSLPEDETELLHILYGQEMGIPYDELRALPPSETLAYIVEHAKRSGNLAEEFSVERARQLFDVYMRNRRLMWNYFPQTYPGSMVLFQALDRRVDDEMPLGMRWNPLVKGKLTTILKSGNHNNLLLRPYVLSVAESLTELLEAFEAEHQAAVVSEA